MQRDVVVVRWPDERVAVERLAAARTPRLLLVGASADPPDGGACEQDWVRLPAEDRDVAARLRSLTLRAANHQALPSVDANGRVHHRGRWVTPSPVEQRIVAVLVEQFGAVVTTEELIERGWPSDRPTLVALRVHITRLKKRIKPLGLDIRGVRPSGYVLEEHDSGEAR